MGISRIKILARLRGAPIRLVIVGPDKAGKTAILHYMARGEFLKDSKPTIGANVESIEMSGSLSATVFDIGGQELLRNEWQNYIQASDVVIYVVDIHNHNRLDEAVSEFRKRVLPVLGDRLCIICGNKLDLLVEEKKYGVLEETITAVEKQLMEIFGKERVNECFATSMVYGGLGIEEIVIWLTAAIKKQKNNDSKL